MENCFDLYLEKRPSFEQKKTLEAKIGALEERFKKLASFVQFLKLSAPSKTKGSSFTPDYYMFEAGESYSISVER